MTHITTELTYNEYSNLYCTPDDVAHIIQYNLPTGFTSETPFTIGHVVDLIYDAMEQIDTITGHAWRERQLTDYEYHNIDNYHLRATGIPIHLNHREIRQFDTTRGDVVEIWDGAIWDNYLETGTEGRNEDYWVDYELGNLYLRSWLWIERPIGIRLKYRYGSAYVPPDIKLTTAKIVAMNILYGEDRSVLLPEGSSNVDYNNKISLFQRDIENVLNRYKEWRIIDSRG